MKERSHFSARLVMLPFHEITAWNCTKLQFMKERSHFNAPFVIFVLQKRASWKDTWNRFMKEISLFNSQVYGARLAKNVYQFSAETCSTYLCGVVLPLFCKYIPRIFFYYQINDVCLYYKWITWLKTWYLKILMSFKHYRTVWFE